MMTKKKDIIAKLIICFFVSFAWMNIGGLESANILLLCVFLSVFFVLTYKDKVVASVKEAIAVTTAFNDSATGKGISERSLKKIRISAVVLGIIFSILYACFADLTGGLENKLFILIYEVCTVIGLFFMFKTLLDIVLIEAVRYTGLKKNLIDNPFSVKVFLIYSFIIFVCCIPFWALNYPGILTPDSLSQLSQAMGTQVYMNHHPWLHTAVIKLFFNIGYGLSSSIHGGIACYTLFQMLMVSISIGYTLECMYEAGISRFFRTMLLLCFILVPFNLLYAITMWKDILFTMAVLVFTVTIIRIERADTGTAEETAVIKSDLRDKVLFFITGLSMCVLRHNGFYAFIATVAIWLFIKRKRLRVYIIMSVAITAIALLCRGPLMRACGVLPGEYVYNMCVPLQQIGRVVVDDEELSDEQQAWLEKINTLDYIRAGYSTQGADPMFAWVLDGNTEYFDSHQGEFIELWLQIGLKHPGTYVKAFLDLTMGYWAPMNPQQTVYFGITENDMELYPKPIIEGPVLIKINELLIKMYEMIPIYGLFYCMGSFFWILLVLGTICICSDSREKLFAFLPVFMLTLTLFIATPLVADVRYGYAILLILPYLAVYTLLIEKKNIQVSTENVED